MGELRANDLNRTRLIHIKAPLRDIEVVSTPVAVVARAQVIIETPEHRIELIHATRRELVRVRTPHRGSQPHIPIDIRVRRTFRRRVLRHVEEAHGVSRSAELLSAAAIVRVHILHIADETIADNHAGGAEFAPAALHRARLEDAAILLLRGDYLAGFVNREGQRLFAVDILTVLHRFHTDVGVPVVRRRNADRVNFGVGNHITKVINDLARVVAIRLIDLLSTRRRTDAIAIANRHDFHIRSILLVEELRNERRAHLNAVANHGNTELLARLKDARAHLGGRAARERHCRRRTEKEATAIQRNIRFH